MLAVVIYTSVLEENDKNYFAVGNGIMCLCLQKTQNFDTTHGFI